MGTVKGRRKDFVVWGMLKAIEKKYGSIEGYFDDMVENRAANVDRMVEKMIPKQVEIAGDPDNPVKVGLPDELTAIIGTLREGETTE